MQDAKAHFNPLDYPQCLEFPARVKAIAWHEHIPFAKGLIQMLRPETIVELGVHTGDSYLAFCETAAALDLTCACRGVDTWKGDEQAGFYGGDVLSELRAYHDPLYGRFSKLIESTFDDATKSVADGSIDLLHIDGLHTYEAVKHDWDAWRPKVSPRGVVLFHDTNVRDRDFGVWRLWEELRGMHRHFEFLHGHGLGVLAMGPEIPPAFQAFLSFGEEHSGLVRRYFFALGSRITLRAKADQIDAVTNELHAKMADVERLKSEIAACNATAREQLERIYNGASFRIGRAITAPFRFLAGKRDGAPR